MNPQRRLDRIILDLEDLRDEVTFIHEQRDITELLKQARKIQLSGSG
jgi:hypothetical protein